MKIIAICFNTPELEQLEFVKPSYGKKYPGAGWMRHLQTFSHSGVDTHVTTGKRAIELLQDKELSAKDVHIIQEENNPDGLFLYGMGANPTVLMCLESPIYASSFYDSLLTTPIQWKHQLLFNKKETLFFPSFDSEDLSDPVPWESRKFLCMVTANKHYSALGEMRSPSFQWALETQLHDYRYAAIEYFHKKPDFDLYGKGWGLEAPECENKLDTIRNYKFALCFENGSYPGYVTEKIVDCFVAGVIPVYRGAPDVYDYIPGELFIDANHYKSFQAMEEDLKLPFDHERKGVAAAQKWLRAAGGRKYNNFFFAKKIVEMCE